MIRIKYDKQLLDSILKRDGAELKGDHDKLRRTTGNITEKTKATKDKGYIYEIWIYTNNGTKTLIK